MATRGGVLRPWSNGDVADPQSHHSPPNRSKARSIEKRPWLYSDMFDAFFTSPRDGVSVRRDGILPHSTSVGCPGMVKHASPRCKGAPHMERGVDKRRKMQRLSSGDVCVCASVVCLGIVSASSNGASNLVPQQRSR